MRVSIIIPAWNEAAGIAATIRDLRTHRPHEIIVVDGGSTDTTIAEASNADRVLVSPLGRACQMNAGAATASGELLLFLHADCSLESGALHAAQTILAKGQTIAGCFTMRVLAEGWAFRSIDACASARVRMTGLVYGDQGLFLRRQDFLRVGGFPAIRFMEDVFFSRSLAQKGRIIVSSKKIHVSPRRWQKVGIITQSLRNWTLTGLALAGISPNRLSQYYPDVR